MSPDRSADCQPPGKPRLQVRDEGHRRAVADTLQARARPAPAWQGVHGGGLRLRWRFVGGGRGFGFGGRDEEGGVLVLALVMVFGLVLVSIFFDFRKRWKRLWQAA